MENEITTLFEKPRKGYKNGNSTRKMNKKMEALGKKKGMDQRKIRNKSL